MNKNVRRMLLCVALIVITMLTLCSCAKEDVYICTASQGPDGEVLKGFHTPQEYGLNMMSEYIQRDDVDKTKSVDWNKNVIYKYERTSKIKKSSTSDEYGDFFCSFDEYECDDGSRIKCRTGSDRVVFYSQSSSKTVIYKGEGEPREIAEEFLQSICSEEEWSKYTHYETGYVDIFEEYKSTYARYIHGYITDEFIGVDITEEGEIDHFDIREIGKYDTLVDDLTKDKLDAAKEKLLNKLTETYGEVEYDEPMIVTNTTGDTFMEISYVYDDRRYSMVVPIE